MTAAILFADIFAPDDSVPQDRGDRVEESDPSPASHISSEERILIDGVRDGDAVVFRQLFDRYYVPLARFAKGYVATSADADEVIADVFLALWKVRSTWSPGGGIASYLFRATRNRARNAVRDERTAQRYLNTAARESVPGMSEMALSADSALDAAERESRLWSAIARLPERSRTLLELRWKGGLSPAEIAATLGISVTATNTGLSRAAKALRGVLPEDFE